MRFTKTIAAAATIATAAVTFSGPAHAGSEDAIIAGALGFGVGTLFGNATARPRYYAPAPVYVAPPPPRRVYVEPEPVYYELEPWTPDWYAYCGSRYRSFDARSGTYTDYDGYRHMCR